MRGPVHTGAPGLSPMTVLMLLFGLGMFGALAAYVAFCDRV